jgi:hypothetical protein
MLFEATLALLARNCIRPQREKRTKCYQNLCYLELPAIIEKLNTVQYHPAPADK